MVLVVEEGYMIGCGICTCLVCGGGRRCSGGCGVCIIIRRGIGVSIVFVGDELVVGLAE